MIRQLRLVNDLVAEGRTGFSFQDARERLGGSPSATANTLRRLTEQGLVDRVNRGHYAIRPLGSLGTSAVNDDLAVAVSAAFGGRLHRIAYRSALSEIGLLAHPVRTVFVACTKQVGFSTVGVRPLRSVVESPNTIHLETEAVEESWRSTLERALLESAMRVDLAGGAERLAEALAMGARDADPKRINRLAKKFGPRGLTAERRLVSLASVLSLPLTLHPLVSKKQSIIRLDPRTSRAEWVDRTFGVAWTISPDELRAVVEN